MEDNIFGYRLRELRKERHLSQHALGEMVGACNQSVSFWETGSREPDLDTLKKLAVFFEVSTDYLLGLTEF